MLPNKKIFCNTPWYELHIYWDGSLGICCQESHKLHSDNHHYNIANMTVMDWFNSEPVRNFRLKMFDQQMPSECAQCHVEEDNDGNSRRLKSNLKSVIFTRQAFDSSWQQSPGHRHFVHSLQHNGHTDTYPIDLHIDLGNFCNLACKMCNARASSTIASQHVRWGLAQDRKYLGTDWTANAEVWHSFKQQLLEIPGLNNIHFMGGETLLTPKFEDLVDWLIKHQRQDICLSFVTNGTVFNQQLMQKLTGFRRVGIEVSIETTAPHNSYVRQGTDTQLVLNNIERYLQLCNNDSITVAIRPAPSLLTIGHFVDLLEYALQKGLIVKSILCREPMFMRIENLPLVVKQQYIDRLNKFLDRIQHSSQQDFNASDPWQYQQVIREQAQMALSVLHKPQPTDVELQWQNLVEHCKKWDQVYKLNARTYYPELVEIWDRYDY